MAEVRSTPTGVSPSNGTTRQRNRGFVTGASEARPGIITTEFWLTVLSAIGIVVAAYISDTFSTDLGWALAAGLIAAYSLSRGLAKCGSREGPFILSGDPGDDR